MNEKLNNLSKNSFEKWLFSKPIVSNSGKIDFS